MKKVVDLNPQSGCTADLKGLSRRAFLSDTGGAALAMAASGLLAQQAAGQSNEKPPAVQDSRKPAVPQRISTKHAKYQHLLSPIKIGNHVLKNRIIGTASSPHFVVAPESYPNETLISYYAGKARDGASIVILSQPFGVHPVNNEDVLKIQAVQPNAANRGGAADDFTLNLGKVEALDFTLQAGSTSDLVEIMDVGHFPTIDLANGGTQNILSQLTQAVHVYDTLCLMKPKIELPSGYDVSPGNPFDDPFAFGERTLATAKGAAANVPGANRKELTEEMLDKIIEETVIEAVLAQSCGFDGLLIHCGYRGPVTARLLSPITNRRTDQYGGSLENRARFTLKLLDAIRTRCGKDFFLMGLMSGREPENGYTIDDGAEFAKMFTGHIDLLSLKGDPGERDSAPTYFIREHTPFLYMTEEYKKRGVTLPLVSDGGFTNLDWAEDALAAGKADAVGMSRVFITTPELGRLAEEGRNEDVVPCLRCNGCHGWGFFQPWLSTCAVNPAWGMESRLNQMISPPDRKKKIAVIGGGPAGMEAALISARRGHDVTLYEKAAKLGGNFSKLEHVSFKWTHKDFNDYLVRRIGKSTVKVRLNAEADPGMIKREGYDAVIVAIGAQPIIPDIPGIRGKNVVFVQDIFGSEENLAKEVVVIGGSQVGTEAGMHLAEKGHRVTVLESSEWLARELVRIHFYSALQNAWQQLPNFNSVLKARCTGITEDGVTYTDADGKQQSIKAGSVVVAMGMQGKTDEAFRFREACDRISLVGDCKSAGDVQNAMRTAFNVASTL